MTDTKQIEADVLQVLDAFMIAWNRLDLDLWDKSFHFPHYRLASGEMKVFSIPGEHGDIREKLADMDWHHSEWDRRRMVHISANKVHVDTKFSRFRQDGSLIATYESLYVLTKQEGRWAVTLRSSFAP